MAANKTIATSVPVKAFLDTITDERVVSDCVKIIETMREVTGKEAVSGDLPSLDLATMNMVSQTGERVPYALWDFRPAHKILRCICRVAMKGTRSFSHNWGNIKPEKVTSTLKD